MKPSFAQAVPSDRPFRMVEGTIRTGLLVYEDTTGQRVSVPNIWYNQPVEWRINAALFYADCAHETVERFRASRIAWQRDMAQRAAKSEARLRALADEMRNSGKILM